ncbi:MAG: helix-turn-helix domain-containing protein [Bauldia sp.]
MAQPYLSQIETGKREGTVDTYRRLARALRVSVDDLI